MKSPLSTCLLLLYLLCIPCLSFLQPSPVSDASSIIPFKVVEDKIIVKAFLNGKPGYFIVDTGYPYLALNNQMFKGKTSQKTRRGIQSGSSPVAHTLVNFTLGDFTIKSAYAEVIDLRRVIASTKIQISGLIGTQFLKSYCVVFDFDNEQLQLFPVSGKKQNIHFPDSEKITAFELTQKGHLLCLSMKISDVPMRFGLDSGAGSNLLAQTKTQPILNALEYLDKRKLGGIGPADVIVDRVRLNAAKLGKLQYPPMMTLLCDMSSINTNLPGKSIDGILGFPFFEAHKMAINYKAKKLFVWPKKREKQQPPKHNLPTIKKADDQG